MDPLVKGLVFLTMAGAGTAITVKLLEKPTTTPPVTPAVPLVPTPTDPQSTSAESTEDKVYGTRFTLSGFLLCLLPFLLLLLLYLTTDNRYLLFVVVVYQMVVLGLDVHHYRHDKKREDHPFVMTISFVVISSILRFIRWVYRHYVGYKDLFGSGLTDTLISMSETADNMKTELDKMKAATKYVEGDKYGPVARNRIRKIFGKLSPIEIETEIGSVEQRMANTHTPEEVKGGIRILRAALSHTHNTPYERIEK